MRHFLNEIEVAPRNIDQIGIISEFVNEVDQLKLTTESIILTREAKNIIDDHIENVGLFEAIPYRIQLNGVSINYYADLLNDLSIRDNEISVKITKRKSQDDFIQKALGTSFDLMKEKGVIFNTFEVPYFVVQDDQISKAITLGITTFVMTQEAIRQYQSVAESINDIIKAVTPSTGAGVVIDWGDVIVLSLRALFRIILFALLVIALIKLATQLFVLIFPPKRKLLATKFSELLKKGCEYLGYQFESTIFEDQPNWALLPVPLIKERKSIYKYLPDEFFSPFNKGYPSTSDSVSTLGQFMDSLKIMFNARLFIQGNIIRLERRDYLYNLSSENIFPALPLQNERSDQYSYNTDEVWKRYYIKYSIDSTDTFTQDEIYDYHDAEYSTEALNIGNQDLISIKGLNQVNIPFALGARKNELTWFEKIAKELFEQIDLVVGLFGGSSNYGSIIGERKDILVISRDFFSITKVLYAVGGKQPPEYTDTISATALYNKYHSINEITNNAFEIRDNVRVRIKDQDFINLLENNYVEIGGQICEIISITHVDEKHESVISYRFPSDYANGKVQIIKVN